MSARRGWCPGVRRPMLTGDGLLVRVHPCAGVLTAAQARLVAEAAEACGNGLLDVTARGNLQLRGVGEAAFPGLLARLGAAGLVEPEGEGPHRLTVLSPLAGLDPADRVDAGALAAAIEAEAPQGLPPKLCVAVDGGGAFPLHEVRADLHLQAVGPREAPSLAIGLDAEGGPLPIGTATPAAAPAIVGAILAAYAGLLAGGRTEARRLRDLAPALRRSLVASAGLGGTVPPALRAPAPRAGSFDLGRDRVALLLALPFGRCTAAQLARAAAWSEGFGAGALRLSFTRGLLVPDVRPRDAAALLDRARRSDFVTEAGDPRLAVAACPGRPACASAAAPSQADAHAIAGAARALLAGGVSLHVSGCAKGCAHPGRADLTLVGEAGGRYGLIVNGTTRDRAHILLDLDEVVARLGRARTPADLLPEPAIP